MSNQKIVAIAKLERDARNFFFVKMLYGYDISMIDNLKSVFEIDDTHLLMDLIDISTLALSVYKCRETIGNTILLYNPDQKFCYTADNIYHDDEFKIIVGTEAHNEFSDINYLVRMLSQTIHAYSGTFAVQYKNKIMSEKEFYEFQGELSVFKM